VGPSTHVKVGRQQIDLEVACVPLNLARLDDLVSQQLKAVNLECQQVRKNFMNLTRSDG